MVREREKAREKVSEMTRKRFLHLRKIEDDGVLKSLLVFYVQRQRKAAAGQSLCVDVQTSEKVDEGSAELT